MTQNERGAPYLLLCLRRIQNPCRWLLVTGVYAFLLALKRSTMLAHVGIIVSDIEQSKRFYRHALRPIGYEMLREYGATPTRPVASAGFGEPPKADLWIYQGDPGNVTTHIAFQVGKRALVDAFYQAAIAAGGRDNGKPGPRAQYSLHYYGAFVLDPDGYNIEAVCREPE